MSETWGDLPESQESVRTILEAVAELIQNHLDDSDAHIEDGQSLKSHKASAIIDHLAGSIVTDKLKDFAITFEKTNGFLLGDRDCQFTGFDSLDGFDTFGDVRCAWGDVLMYATDAVSADLYPIAGFRFPEWSKSPKIQARVYFENSSDNLFYIGIGSEMPGGSGSDESFAAFKVSGANLYASVKIAGVEHNTLLTGLFDDSVFMTFEIDVIDDEKVDFYVNGELAYSEETYVLNSSVDCVGANLFYVYASALSASNHGYHVCYLMFAQDY